MPIFTTKTGQGINLDPINVPANTTVRVIAAPYDVDLATLPMLPVSGGTANYLTKFTGTSTLGNSLFRDDGTSIGLGIAPSAGALLDVYGTVRSTALTMKGLYPILTIDYAMAMAGTAIQIMTNGLMRWQATISGSEAGSNGGSNYNLNRYADDGTTVLGSLLAATRASGLVKVNGTILQVDTFGVGIKTVPSATDALDVNGTALLRSTVTGYGLWSLTNADPRLRFNETDGATNAKVHDFVNQAGIFYGRTYDDAISGNYNWLQVARTSGSVNVATITLSSATAVNLTSPLVAVTNGNLSVAHTGATVVASINKENGQSGVLSFQQVGLPRWQLWENNTAETGSDVGSNLVLGRYSDAGSLLGTSLEITRSTGEIGMGTPVSAGWRVNVASGTTGSLYANGPIGLATVTGAIQFWGGSPNYSIMMKATAGDVVAGPPSSDYNMYFKMTGADRSFVFMAGATAAAVTQIAPTGIYTTGKLVAATAAVTTLVSATFLATDAGGNLVAKTGTVITGGGTVNYLARYTPNGSTLGNSLLQDDGTNVGVGIVPSATALLNVAGAIQGYGVTSFGTVGASLTVDAGTSTATLRFRRSSSTRWSFGQTSTLESGANVGSDLLCLRVADDGLSSLGAWLAVTRASGLINFNNGVLQVGSAEVGLQQAPVTGQALSVTGGGAFSGQLSAGSGTLQGTQVQLQSTCAVGSSTGVYTPLYGLLLDQSAAAGATGTRAAVYALFRKNGDSVPVAAVINAGVYAHLDAIITAKAGMGTYYGVYTDIEYAATNTLSTFYNLVAAGNISGAPGIIPIRGGLLVSRMHASIAPPGLVSHYGVYVGDLEAGSTITAAFRSDLSTGTNKYAFYAQGSAVSQFNGALGILQAPDAANYAVAITGKVNSTLGFYEAGVKLGGMPPLTQNYIFVGNASNVATGVTTSSLAISAWGPATASLNMNGVGGPWKISGLADPVSPLDAVNLQYVQALTQGAQVKTAVRVVTAAPLPAHTTAGNVMTASANGVLSVDGVTMVANDRVLVRNEGGANPNPPDHAMNGIYVVTNAGAVGAAWVLTRSTDTDTGAEMMGARTYATEGLTQAGNSWTVSTIGAITINVTPIGWVLSGQSAVYSAGDGLALNGAVFSALLMSPLGFMGTTPKYIGIPRNASPGVIGQGATGIDPAWLNASVDGTVLRFKASTLGFSQVDWTEIANRGSLGSMVALSVLANATNATAAPTALTAAAADQFLVRRGTTLVFGTLALTDLPANITAGYLTASPLSMHGNVTTATGPVSDMTIPTVEAICAPIGRNSSLGGATRQLLFKRMVVYGTLQGDGTKTSFTLTTGLATRDCVVSVRADSGTYDVVMVSVTFPTVNTCVVGFTSPPPAGATGKYRVIVMAVEGMDPANAGDVPYYVTMT